MQADTAAAGKDVADVGDLTSTSKTIFGIIRKFEPVQARTIRTEPLLQSCQDLTGILDHLGSSFSLAKKDMMGNIKKVDDHYKRNPQLYATLNAILEEESHLKTKPGHTATGVIWLKRALDFLRAFITGLSREHHKKVEHESLRRTVMDAYDVTLRPYHGAMTQFLFANISRLVPYRKTFLKTLMVEPTATVDMVISDMDMYLPTFSVTLDILDELLNEFGLTSQEKV